MRIQLLHQYVGRERKVMGVGERDRVFIGNQREQLQREPAQYPSRHIKSLHSLYHM